MHAFFKTGVLNTYYFTFSASSELKEVPTIFKQALKNGYV